MKRTNLYFAGSVALAFAVACGGSTSNSSDAGGGSDSGSGSGSSGSGASSSSGSGSGGSQDASPGGDGGAVCQCVRSPASVLHRWPRGRRRGNEDVFVRRRPDLLPHGVVAGRVHQRAELWRRPAVLLRRRRRRCDQRHPMHDRLRDGHSPRLRDQRRLHWGSDVPIAGRRRVRLLWHLPAAALVRGHGGLHDGSGVLSGCGRWPEYLSDGVLLRHRAGVRDADRLRHRPGVLHQYGRRRQ
jgi:hypothetical protein